MLLPAPTEWGARTPNPAPAPRLVDVAPPRTRHVAKGTLPNADLTMVHAPSTRRVRSLPTPSPRTAVRSRPPHSTSTSLRPLRSSRSAAATSDHGTLLVDPGQEPSHTLSDPMPAHGHRDHFTAARLSRAMAPAPLPAPDDHVPPLQRRRRVRPGQHALDGASGATTDLAAPDAPTRTDFLPRPKLRSSRAATPAHPPTTTDPAPTARKDSVLDIPEPHHCDTHAIPSAGNMLPSPADAGRALRRSRCVLQQTPTTASLTSAAANESADTHQYYMGPVDPPAPFPQPVLRPSPAKRAHVTEIAPAATVPLQGTVATELAQPRRRRPRRPESASASAPPVSPVPPKSVLRGPTTAASNHHEPEPPGSLLRGLQTASAEATKRTVTFAPVATVSEYDADPSSSSSSVSSVPGAAPDVHANHVAHAAAIDDLFYAAASTASRPATPAPPAALAQPPRSSHRSHAFDELWAVDVHLEAANPEHYHPSPWQRPHRYCRPAPAGMCEWPKCPPMIWPAVPIAAAGSRDKGDENEYSDERKAPVAGMCVPQRLRGGRPGSAV
ncbi:hypothetical protein AMAG_07638 [Allomyces macrogynus ATCC 38327]|uniref:Uncharacterized protein n=1 Tax=Allomyces macrogynus (strain ATCC 38327) TaxID=578462 RepID=A0A0L0SIW0_ALLM3|nr:hypothetical protein AMAG_07638 [Allomyces macrogynus ATCC 38327]|eukprot:KNE62417.1 hypothetical protein AMAG_07638 [Allomyces macrogynus ATCC 38327]